MNKIRTATTITTLGLVAMMMAGCASAAGSTPSADPVSELRLGYFANVTHAPALVGLEEGLFQDALGDVKVTTSVFNAGPAAIEALTAGAIDATYIGPNPSINTFIQSAGESARIIAGAATGGAALVVRDGIDTPSDLEGATLATPQLGNTQDVALRSWLADEGFETDTTGGGDVSITPTENAQTLTLFQQGDIDGAWVPEPYASILVNEGGKVLVNEADLWPKGQFVTTQLLVNTDFLKAHPDLVTDLLTAHVESNDLINKSPDEAKQLVKANLEELTKATIPTDVFESAWSQLTFTNDPLQSTLAEDAKHATDVGLLDPVENLSGLYDLAPLNAVLKAAGESEVASS